MSEDKLEPVLQEKLGALAKPVLSGFLKNFENLSSSDRNEIADKLIGIDDKSEAMKSLIKYANEISNRGVNMQLPNDKLSHYLEPILGTACAVEVVERLENFNPELRGNDNLQDKFIQIIEDTPEDDKLHMVAAALKISKIREVLRDNGDDFEYAEAYKDFESITSRLLKNFYNIAKYAENIFSDENLSEDEKMNAIGGPIFSAQVIMLNDNIEKALTPQQAKKEVDLTINSAGGGMNDFKLLVKYVAEKSEQAAEIVFNTKEFREFSKWEKYRLIQDANQPNISDMRSRGIQNG